MDERIKDLSASGSVTQWLEKLKAGESDAAQRLWERYFLQLAALARGRLAKAARRAADEEDVALSAFDSFCRGVERGRFPQLQDRDNLWRLLVVITDRKAVDLIHHEQRKKRGGANRQETAQTGGVDQDEDPLAQIIDREPTPAFAAQVAEECERLLNLLDDGDLRSVALWKMEGYTNHEIAGKLGRAPRAVERMLQFIRKVWSQELSP